MNAAISSEPTSFDPDPRPRHATAVILSRPSRDSGEASENNEKKAEGAVFRDAAVGALLGVIVCVPIWVGLVAIALRNAGTALLPPLAMAAGIGVLAGMFMGGWAGTLVGATTLDEFERAARATAFMASRSPTLARHGLTSEGGEVTYERGGA